MRRLERDKQIRREARVKEQERRKIAAGAIKNAIRYGYSWGYAMDDNVAYYSFTLEESGLRWNCKPTGVFSGDDAASGEIMAGFNRRMIDAIPTQPGDIKKHLLSSAYNAGLRGPVENFCIHYDYKGYVFLMRRFPEVTFNLDSQGQLVYSRRKIFIDDGIMAQYDRGLGEFVKANEEFYKDWVLAQRKLRLIKRIFVAAFVVASFFLVPFLVTGNEVNPIYIACSTSILLILFSLHFRFGITAVELFFIYATWSVASTVGWFLFDRLSRIF